MRQGSEFYYCSFHMLTPIIQMQSYKNNLHIIFKATQTTKPISSKSKSVQSKLSFLWYEYKMSYVNVNHTVYHILYIIAITRFFFLFIFFLYNFGHKVMSLCHICILIALKCPAVLFSSTLIKVLIWRQATKIVQLMCCRRRWCIISGDAVA